jgi:hypothetical protein
VDGHPVRITVDDDLRRSRLTVFFRPLFVVPHSVWLLLWSGAAFLAAIANWVVVLVRGHSAESLHRFLAAYIRYVTHVTAFLFLVANPFPGFTGTLPYPVDVAIDPPERQKRWVTLLRGFLALPAFLLASAFTAVLAFVCFLGWFAALATGRMPTGLRNLGAFCISYVAEAKAYWLLITDAYPRPHRARHVYGGPEPA